MLLHPRKTSRRSPSNAPLTENQGLSYALRLLKVRSRSVMEVARRLQERGLPGFQIDSILQQLTKLRLLDDERFARDWIRWRDRMRPSGAQLLQHELLEKGIAAELIESVLVERESATWREDIGIENDGRSVDEQLAETLVAKRRERLAGLPQEKQQQRLLDLLVRRGFSYAVAYKLALQR